MNTLALDKLEVYQLSEIIADKIWSACEKWDYFPRDTLGKQLVRAADSIGANIAEGYGRYTFKENLQFCHYARVSLMETKHFLRRAMKRNLLPIEYHDDLAELTGKLAPKLNAYIRSIRQRARMTTDQ